MARDVVDFVSAPDPATLGDLGAAPYTGNARPDQAWFDAAAGHVDWMTQETYSTRSTEGYAVGAADCAYAEQRARERGWSGPIAVVVSDGNYADYWDASGYGQGWSDTASLRYFPYGAKQVTASFLAGAARGRGAALVVLGEDGAPGDWVPETWGRGTVASQVVGPSPIPSSDLNHVHVELGPTPAPSPSWEDDEMYVMKCEELGACGVVSEFRVAGYPTAEMPAGLLANAVLVTKDEFNLEIAERKALAAALGSSGGGGGEPPPPSEEQVQGLKDAVAADMAARLTNG